VNLYADRDIDSPVLPTPPASEAFPDGIGDIDWNGNGTYEADDNLPDDITGDSVFTKPDIDNYPLNWAPAHCANADPTTCTPGPEDIDRSGDTHFDMGDAIAVVWTDSWTTTPPPAVRVQTTRPEGKFPASPMTAASTACATGTRSVPGCSTAATPSPGTTWIA
jgi:hypothetical protein